MKIVFTSTNKAKVIEVKAILGDLHEITYLADYNDIPEPDEPYGTFIENAIHKAKYYAKFLEKQTLADDSGVCIEALDGFPGVDSKGFIIECGGVNQMFAKLEKMLEGKDKTAYFQTSVASYDPESDTITTGEGVIRGKIQFPALGNSHAAFDSIFIPDGYHKTLAELGKEVKNKISARNKAIREIALNWNQ